MARQYLRGVQSDSTTLYIEAGEIRDYESNEIVGRVERKDPHFFNIGKSRYYYDDSYVHEVAYDSVYDPDEPLIYRVESFPIIRGRTQYEKTSFREGFREAWIWTADFCIGILALCAIPVAVYSFWNGKSVSIIEEALALALGLGLLGLIISLSISLVIGIICHIRKINTKYLVELCHIIEKALKLSVGISILIGTIIGATLGAITLLSQNGPKVFWLICIFACIFAVAGEIVGLLISIVYTVSRTKKEHKK